MRNKDTFKGYLYRFNIFLLYLEKSGIEPFNSMSPVELVQWVKDQPKIDDRYAVVDLLLGWKTELENSKLRAKSIKTGLSIVRSFFDHNRATLPPDKKLWDIRPDTPEVDGELFAEEIRKMILSCNETYQAIYLCMFQAGLDKSSFLRWNAEGWESLQSQLAKGSHPIEIKINGRKMNRNKKPFHTYLGRDSVEALKLYINTVRPRGGTHIFYNKHGNPVSENSVYYYWLRHLRRLGLIRKQGHGKRNRYGKNPHEMRDTFRSLWTKSQADATIGEYCLGHTGDPLGYDKAYKDRDFRMREYLKAEPWLNIMSETEAYGQVTEIEYHTLRGEIETLQRDDITRQSYIDHLETRIKELEARPTQARGIQRPIGDTNDQAAEMLRMLTANPDLFPAFVEEVKARSESKTAEE